MILGTGMTGECGGTPSQEFKKPHTALLSKPLVSFETNYFFFFLPNIQRSDMG